MEIRIEVSDKSRSEKLWFSVSGMSKRIKVTIDANGFTSEILRIRETTTGDLTILFKRSDQLSAGSSRLYTDTAENRLSVHVTPDQEYNTFKHHLRYANGRYDKLYTKIMPSDGRMMHMAYACSTAEPVDEESGLMAADLSAIINAVEAFGEDVVAGDPEGS